MLDKRLPNIDTAVPEREEKARGSAYRCQWDARGARVLVQGCPPVALSIRHAVCPSFASTPRHGRERCDRGCSRERTRATLAALASNEDISRSDSAAESKRSHCRDASLRSGSVRFTKRRSQRARQRVIDRSGDITSERAKNVDTSGTLAPSSISLDYLRNYRGFSKLTEVRSKKSN